MSSPYTVPAIIVVTLATVIIGAYGLRLARTTSDFLVASRTVSPRWNAAAIGGEYLSAASFLGVAGLVLTSILTAMVWLLAAQFSVPLDFPLFIDIPVAITLPIIAILSGMLSLRILGRTQPADLLR